MVLIKDLEFNPQFTDEQYDRCIKFFASPDERRPDYNSCTKFIIVGDNDPSINGTAACHAAIGSNYVENPALVATEIALVRRELQDCDGAWQFLDWMLNDSFASRFIVNKPEHRTLKYVGNNGIIVSTDIPQPLFQMIMIFSRSHSERSNVQFAKWKELVDDGFDPNFAYQVCMCVTGGPVPYYFKPTAIVATRTGHTTTFLLNMDSMKLWCAQDLGTGSWEKRTYRQYKSLFGCGKLFMMGASVPYSFNFYKDLFRTDPEFVSRMQEFRGESTTKEGYRPPNPFARTAVLSTRKPDDLTYQEYFEALLPYIKEKGLFYVPKN